MVLSYFEKIGGTDGWTDGWRATHDAASERRGLLLIHRNILLRNCSGESLSGRISCDSI